jgi:hypothetical protein
MVEASVEGTAAPAEDGGDEMPSPFWTYDAGGGEIPSPFEAPAEEVAQAAIEEPVAEEIVQAAIEGAEIPPVEPMPEPEREPEPELETAGAGNGGSAEAEPPSGSGGEAHLPEGVDIHAVTEKPASPRRGWWTRLIQ